MTAWLGRWEPIPELSIYPDPAQAPAAGTYTIAEGADATLDVHIRWTTQGGETHQARFAAPRDGTPVHSRAPDVDTFSILAEDAHTLSGDAMHAGRRVRRAMRRVSTDGRLMSVLQVRDFRDGPRDHVFQVYRRADG